MKKILVAVDFSACSRRAFQTAVSLSRAFHAPLHVVHVAPEIYHHLDASAAILPIRPNATLLERRLSELILEEFKGSADEFARIDKAILEGIDWLEILKEADRRGASLIVLGTHGRSAIERVFLGSVSDRVLHNSPLPVLLVPEKGHIELQSLLVALEGAIDEIEPVLRAAETWRAALNARMTVLRVIEASPSPELEDLPEDVRADLNLSGWEEQIRQSIEWAASRVSTGETPPAIELRHGRTHREIRRLLEDDDFDLCVLGASRDPGLSLEPSIMKLVHHCPCAVLVLG